MSTITSKTSGKVPKSYQSLIAMFPLRPIRTEADYGAALEAAEALVGNPRLTNDQADYLDILTDIVQKYEAGHYEIAGKQEPLKTLATMLEERGMNASDLGRVLGNRTLGAAVLRGDRQLSKAHIRTLADFFKVSSDLFL